MSVRSSFSAGIRKFIHSRGRELVHPDVTYLIEWHRPRLFKKLGINLVFDAGANVGQTGLGLRAEGYTGRIVSLEPLSGPYAQLTQTAAKDGNWLTKRCAVGDKSGEATMNVSKETVYSSLLGMDKFTHWIDPSSAYVTQEKMPMASVGDLLSEFAKPQDHICLKLDVQGYELEVMRGAGEHLKRMDMIQLELTFPKMYEGQPKYYDVLKFLDDAGFEPAGMVPLYRDPRTERYYQADALFARAVVAGETTGAGA